MEEKKLYWRMYQDKNSTAYNSVVLNGKTAMKEIRLYFEYQTDEDIGPPVFEPVMMTDKEFEALPEFTGY